jgi:hypothetical protein
MNQMESTGKMETSNQASNTDDIKSQMGVTFVVVTAFHLYNH